MLVVCPLPDKGISIFDKAWEWTVYLVQGVWRCLRENKSEHRSTSSFFVPPVMRERIAEQLNIL